MNDDATTYDLARHDIVTGQIPISIIMWNFWYEEYWWGTAEGYTYKYLYCEPAEMVII